MIKLQKIISEKEFQNILIKAVNILCNPVIKTLGPKGSNVILSNSDSLPFITNDGVTIAKSIESNDEAINAILTILKEASLKTDEEVGDGTTTTLVLLKSIILNGLEEINKGENSLNLKKRLTTSLDNILNLLEKEKFKPSPQNYYDIALTSSNDLEISKIITNAFLKVKAKSAIKIKESNFPKTYLEKKNGYYFESGVLSNAFLKNQKEIILNDCYLLLIDYFIEDVASLTTIYNMMIEEKHNLIILADSFSDEIKQTTLEINREQKWQIILINAIDYVEKKKEIFEDLEILTNAKIVKYPTTPTIDDLGFSKQIKCTKDETTVIGNKTSKLKSHIKKLTKLSCEIKETFYLEEIKERIHKLKQNNIIVYVGGYTKTARKELIMRYIDALSSLNQCQDGVIYGSGLTLYKISKQINDEIVKKALESPIRQIIKNNNLDENKILLNIQKYNYQKIYNVEKDSFENVTDTKIIDAYLVVKKALETAFSIASLVLTTSNLVINHPKDSSLTNYLDT